MSNSEQTKQNNEIEEAVTSGVQESESGFIEEVMENASTQTLDTDTDDESMKPTEVSDVQEEEDETLTALIAELTEARIAADVANDQALRAQAELQNFRRRKERESSERIAQANARLILDLLPVVDDFERAFDNVPEGIGEENSAWVEGFRLILRKLQTVLEREGVTVIDTNGEFDPSIHEAISMEPNEDVESGHIIDEVRRGYKLKDRVLRPSVVRVAQ